MPAKQDNMPGIALAFGIGAFLFMMFGITPLFASMGIIFGLLSRREVTDKRAVIGLFLSTASLVVYCLIIAAAIYILLATGTMAQILEEISALDPGSVNAPVDAMAIIQRNLLELYNSMLSQAGAPITGTSGVLFVRAAGLAAGGA